VKDITAQSFTDEVAAFTALSGLIRGWGNYYAYAAESRLMDSLDAYIYQQLWQYCRRKHPKAGAKAVYQLYTLPLQHRRTGYFQIGVVVGEQVMRIPRLSSIARQALRLGYPPHPYLPNERQEIWRESGISDERWWDQHVWAGQEGARKGQRRLAVEVLARDATCQICGAAPAEEAHHDPPWRESHKHEPHKALGVCQACHRQQLHGADG
jgi:hypothetical protein